MSVEFAPPPIRHNDELPGADIEYGPQEPVTIDAAQLAGTVVGQNTVSLETEGQAQNQERAERRTGECVKQAPDFMQQASDISRTNPIEYVHGSKKSLGVATEGHSTDTLTEQQSLAGVRGFLEKAAVELKDEDPFLAGCATSMLENMTFIGKREYDEAVHAIGRSWLGRLKSDPEAQLCVITNEISNLKVKSDAYMLDNILKTFSDEELDEVRGRLVLDPEELTAEPGKAGIILIDDWTVSGSQLRTAGGNIAEKYPQYKDKLEIQLIAASAERIQEGLEVKEDPFADKTVNVPVSAYYAAHAASKEYAAMSGAHIAGWHCAVDIDYNINIDLMATAMQVDMPPATNIVRPYRKPGVELTQHHRLQQPRQEADTIRPTEVAHAAEAEEPVAKSPATQTKGQNTQPAKDRQSVEIPGAPAGFF